MDNVMTKLVPAILHLFFFSQQAMKVVWVSLKV